MDKQHEIEKIIEIVKVPITDINIVGSSVELFYHNESIGHLRVTPVETHGPTMNTYSNEEKTFYRFKWDAIFKRNIALLTTLVRDYRKNPELTITAGTFGNIYAMEPDTGNKFLFGCVFENGSWRVYAK